MLPTIRKVFSKHYRAIILKKTELKSTFQNPPMAALRQPPNIRKILCWLSLYPIRRSDKFVRSSYRTAQGGKNKARAQQQRGTVSITGNASNQIAKISQNVNTLVWVPVALRRDFLSTNNISEGLESSSTLKNWTHGQMDSTKNHESVAQLSFFSSKFSL